MSKRDASLPSSFLSQSLAKIVQEKLASTLKLDWVGQQVGSYCIDSLIGTGAHGAVFRASRSEPYEQTVAIKLFPALRGQDDRSARFREECQVLADLDHQHIASILDANLTDDRTPYLIMPLIEGISIREYVAQNQCSYEEIALLGSQLTRAVAFAHRHNVVHCDLKPDNILVDETGFVTVTDFGLAVRVDHARAAVQPPSGAPGTIGYAAPEVLTAPESAGLPVDVYSIGAVLYELLSGQPPHGGGMWLDAMIAAATCDPELVRARNPEVPVGLGAICDGCLKRNPSERWRASDLEVQFDKFLENRSKQRGASRARSVRRIGVAALSAAIIVTVGMMTNQPKLTPTTIEHLTQPAAPLPEEEVARILKRIENDLLRPGTMDPSKPGDFPKLFRMLKQASSELSALLGQAPDNKKVRERAAIGYFLLGRAAHWVDEPTYADSSLARSEQMFRDLHRDYPNDGYMFDFFHTIIVQSGRASDREERDLLLLALGVIEGLNDAPGADLDHKDALACTYALLADVYSMEGSELFDLEKAEPLAKRALRVAIETCESPGSIPLHRKQIMRANFILSKIARLRADLGKSLEYGETAYLESVRLDEALRIADTADQRFHLTKDYAVALVDAGRLQEAEKHLVEAEDLVPKLIKLQWLGADRYPAVVEELRASLKLAKSKTPQPPPRLNDSNFQQAPNVEHSGDVWSVHTSTLGAVASGDDAGVVRIWNDNGAAAGPFGGTPLFVECCEAHVWAVEFSPDGTLLAVGGADGSLSLLEPGSGNLLWSLSLTRPRMNTQVKDVAISHDNKWVAAATGRRVLVFDVESKEQVFSLGHRADENVAFGPNRPTIYSTRHRENHVWEVLEFDTESRELLRVLPAGREQIYHLSVSSSGMIAVAGYQGNVRLWEEDATEPTLLTTTKKPVWSTAFSDNGKFLAAGCSDGAVRVWNTNTTTLVTTLPGHKRWVRGVSFTEDAVYSGSDDGQLRGMRFEPERGDSSMRSRSELSTPQ